ncbi:hypothetical protein EB796_009085 [Bugula neritina]|uniref:Plant heme peroxidase family profile domain-containing protein n=1 Tax=Bugula neritina TaxID=10212 RepID=A0A7J7K340_BUGNE|nr:hypothetical protein EB796_009085 [Bugula neritina]
MVVGFNVIMYSGPITFRPFPSFGRRASPAPGIPATRARPTQRRCSRHQQRRGLCGRTLAAGATPPIETGSRPPFQLRQSENVEQLRNAIKVFINNDHEMIPNLIQLVFHTCIGGCDGCINEEEPANRGLRGTYAAVRQFWGPHASLLTLADTIVLMASEAIKISMEMEEGSGTVNVPFTSGRRTCQDPDNYNRELVFPHGDKTDDVAQLVAEFGLSRKQAIALLGAHSVGRCRLENSGFAGRWDNTELILDNHYYKSLVGTDWKSTLVSGQHQWNATESDDSRMMLNSDLALLKDFSMANNQPSCSNSKSCRDSSDASQVKIYARNGEEWRRDFIQAFLKMVNKGL